MVHLFTCQARPADAAEGDVRCGATVSHEQPFCSRHYEEYMALVKSVCDAAAEVARLDDSIDHMLSRDADGYTNAAGVQKNIEDVERCMKALDIQVESMTVMSRRFFSEPDSGAHEGLAALDGRRSALASWLQGRNCGGATGRGSPAPSSGGATSGGGTRHSFRGRATACQGSTGAAAARRGCSHRTGNEAGQGRRGRTATTGRGRTSC
ncbi:hypothetical protein C8Q74DRAFT_246345 [Fomes fomentarius]|nr:hypothetical protein C8Q74DRAFT_246345 [Fomes fomentarius]